MFENAPQPLRLLIADDQRLFVRMVEAMLSREQMIEVVGSARDGAEAVELAASLRPDVVLMDVDMPRMDGFEAAERIREHDRSVRVVIVTGSGSPPVAEHARRVGASGYVTKDRIATELVGAILSEPAA